MGKEQLSRAARVITLAGGLTILAGCGSNPTAEGNSPPPPSTPDSTPTTHIVINNATASSLPIFVTKPGHYSEANNHAAWELPTEITPKTDPEKIEEATNGKISASDIDCSRLSSDDPYKEQCIVDFGSRR